MPGLGARRRRDDGGRWGSGAAAAGAVEVAAVALGWAAHSGGAEAGPLERVAGWWGWALVDQAGGGRLGPDPGLDEADDLDHPLAVPGPHADGVAGLDRRRGLGPHAVDLDVAGAAGLGRPRPRLGQPHRPQPAVDPRLLHPGLGALARRWADPPGGLRRLLVPEGLADRAQGRGELAGDDPHRARLALGELGQGLEVLVGQQLGVGVVLVDGLEHGLDRPGLPLGLEDGRLAIALGPEDGALLLTLGGQDLRLAHTPRGRGCPPAFPGRGDL